LHDRFAAELDDACQPGRAVGVGAGQDDADAALAMRLGSALEQNVDRGP
jgi:hypothetical protein